MLWSRKRRYGVLIRPQLTELNGGGETVSKYDDYQKDIVEGIRECTLNFEMWLRYVKKMKGQEIYQLNVNPDAAKSRELHEEYTKWKEKK